MSSRSKIKSSFIERSWIVWSVLAIIGMLAIYKIILFQTKEKEKLLSVVKNVQIKEGIIEAKRGNIYASDGNSILATSTLEYKIILDPSVANKVLFDSSINSLSEKLSKFFGERSPSYYKEKITQARNSGSKYVVLNNKWLTYEDKKILEEFPLFNIDIYKGGGYFKEKEHRFHPYRSLAERTIGSLDKETQRTGHTGIEFEFDADLKGIDGKGIYERLAGNYFKPINQESDIAAKPGKDVVTTLDVNFQDIAESALRNQVGQTQAKYGSVVIMEVETGEIKAMTNITRHIDGNGSAYYSDDINYAVMVGTDPGSTFKLASMLAILEKTDIKPTDFAANCNGAIMHNSARLRCSHAHGNLSVQQVFEQSCNVGVYLLMKKVFGFSKSSQFYEYLDRFMLTKPTAFQLKGEPVPLINRQDSKFFSSTTIPWMSIGYETRITPMQMLTFYNAVANNGRWIQPLLVREIKSGNTVVKQYKAKSKSSPFASEKSIKEVQQMMAGVVNQGTAKNIKLGECDVAGKTGTALKNRGGKYEKEAYYTSFIGYFPAEKPKYSIVVVIDEPTGRNVHGGDVCAPVFRTIADKIYAYDMGMHKSLLVKENVDKTAKEMAVGKATDQLVIARKLNYKNRPEGDGWLKPNPVKKDSVAWQNIRAEGEMQNVVGLTLKDALPILENKNYVVRHSGMGRVTEVNYIGGRTVNLVLQ